MEIDKIDEDIPKAILDKKESPLDTPMSSSEKTNEILNQINEYLEQEKNS